jgi:hypothetical protein
MFVIDWILGKFNYHKFYKIDEVALWAEFEKQDAAKAAAPKKPAIKKTVRKKV